MKSRNNSQTPMGAREVQVGDDPALNQSVSQTPMGKVETRILGRSRRVQDLTVTLMSRETDALKITKMI